MHEASFSDEECIISDSDIIDLTTPLLLPKKGIAMDGSVQFFNFLHAGKVIHISTQLCTWLKELLEWRVWFSPELEVTIKS